MFPCVHSQNPEFDLRNRRGRILVVDDQPTNIRLIHQIFNREHDVFMATNGAQALTFCRDTPPDLVLLDVVMPEMNGLEICRRLKRDESTAGIPVIFVTAHNDEEEENACWDAGGVDFVSKPVNSRTLANRVRAHLTLKFQADLMRDLAFLDGLTGVANRRFFDERLAQEWRRCQRACTALSLVLLDIDHFKAYNDTYGHQGGDECLQQVAAAIRQRPQRSSDLVARYGGEEFAALLPETSLDGAVAVAKRIEATVRALRIEHRTSRTERIVTLSLGVATQVPEPGRAPEVLVGLADRQLYLAKQQGRGRVCFDATGAGFQSGR